MMNLQNKNKNEIYKLKETKNIYEKELSLDKTLSKSE